VRAIRYQEYVMREVKSNKPDVAARSQASPRRCPEVNKDVDNMTDISTCKEKGGGSLNISECEGGGAGGVRVGVCIIELQLNEGAWQ
jgi:hypothetical protein